MVGGDTLLLLLDMPTVAGVEEDDVPLGLPVETPIDYQSPIVQHRTVPKPKTIAMISHLKLVIYYLSKSAEKSDVGIVF